MLACFAGIGEILEVLLNCRGVFGWRFFGLKLGDGVAILGLESADDLGNAVTAHTTENPAGLLGSFARHALALRCLAGRHGRALSGSLTLTLSLPLALRLLHLGHGLGQSLLRLLHGGLGLFILGLGLGGLGLDGLSGGVLKSIGRLLKSLLGVGRCRGSGLTDSGLGLREVTCRIGRTCFEILIGLGREGLGLGDLLAGLIECLHGLCLLLCRIDLLLESIPGLGEKFIGSGGVIFGSLQLIGGIGDFAGGLRRGSKSLLLDFLQIGGGSLGIGLRGIDLGFQLLELRELVGGSGVLLGLGIGNLFVEHVCRLDQAVDNGFELGGSFGGIFAFA